MHTKDTMNENINIRLDSETADALRTIKSETGVSPAQIARTGLQKTIAQFKRDGFLKMETTATKETHP